MTTTDTEPFNRHNLEVLTEKLGVAVRLQASVERVAAAFPAFGGQGRWNGLKAEAAGRIEDLQNEMAVERAKPIRTPVGDLYLDRWYTLVVKNPHRRNSVARTLKSVQLDGFSWGATMQFSYVSRRHLYLEAIEIQSIVEEVEP